MDPHRVLVVDDEGTIRHVLQSLLEMKKCDVRTAGSAEDAVALLEGWEPEVAMLDIVLPGKNGLQFMKELKLQYRNTEILVMTSNSSADTALQAVRQGAYDYLTKPFVLPEVWTTVQRAIEQRNLSLKNRALLDKQEERSRELSSAVDFVGDEGEEDELESVREVLGDFVRVVTEELDVDRASIMLLDEAGEELRIAAQLGMSTLVDVDSVRVRKGEGVSGIVAETGEPFLVTDASSDERITSPLASAHADSFLSVPVAMAVPIKSEQRVLGVINVTERRSGAPLGPEDVAFLSGLAGQLAVAIEGARRSEKLQKAYEKLRSTQDQLVFSERIQAVGQMAAGVAHDFNNALSVILARTQFITGLLEKDAPDLDKVRTNLATIKKTALQGAEAIKRIQDYTRIRKDVPHGPVSINSVVEDAVEMARPKWKEHVEAEGNSVDVELSLQEVPSVAGNVYELTQVVSNLIFNAVEAMPYGGRLSFRTRSDGDNVVLEVADTGTGMDEETQKRLFEPFFTTKDSGQGLGTSILYGIVTRHGGKIDVDSAVGRGTVFTVTLPKLDEEQQVAAEGPHSDQAFRAARILLVDDDDLVRETYEEALTMGGHEVFAASSGRRALSMFDKHHPDLVITDLSMAGMTGLELAAQLKGRDASVSVVLLSGWAIQQEQDDVREAGVDAVLLKPCLVEDLLEAVQQTMRPAVGRLAAVTVPSA
jgi:signal transduction histidine kinase